MRQLQRTRRVGFLLAQGRELLRIVQQSEVPENSRYMLTHYKAFDAFWDPHRATWRAILDESGGSDQVRSLCREVCRVVWEKWRYPLSVPFYDHPIALPSMTKEQAAQRSGRRRRKWWR